MCDSVTARHTTAVGEQEEDSDDQAGDREGNLFNQEQPSDHHFNDGHKESGSIHPRGGEPHIRQSTMSTGHGFNPCSSLGAGTSTFPPSIPIGYTPGTGDPVSEDDLEVMDGRMKNRRGHRT